MAEDRLPAAVTDILETPLGVREEAVLLAVVVLEPLDLGARGRLLGLDPLLLGDTPRLVRDRAEFLADRCAVDPEIVWEWGYIERVSTGLASLRDFDDDHGAKFLEVARRCL